MDESKISEETSRQEQKKTEETESENIEARIERINEASKRLEEVEKKLAEREYYLREAEAKRKLGGKTSFNAPLTQEEELQKKAQEEADKIFKSFH